MESVPESIEPGVPPPSPEAETETAQSPPAPDAPVDPAADKAFADEIKRMDDGENWDPSKARSGVDRSAYQAPRPTAGALVQPRPAPMYPDPPPVIEASRAPHKLNSLEDLYRAFPQIGDGMTFLRVERKAPKVWGGAVVAGILKDLHEQISVQDFHGQFGGHDYIVSVMGPDVARSDDDLTQPKMREMARLRLQFPGPPAFGTAPVNMNEDDYMLRGSQQAGFPRAVPLMDPAVEMKRMEIEDAQRQRQSLELKELAGKYGALVADASRAPEGVIKSLETAQDRSFTEMKAAHESVLANLRESNTNMLRVRDELEKQVRELQTEMVAVKTKAAEDLRSGETKAVGELKERYAKDFTEINARHAGELSELKDRHNRDLNELRERMGVEMKRVTDEGRQKLDDMQRKHLDDQAQERLRNADLMTQGRNDSKERIEQMKNDFARAETNLREDYKTRMTELQHNTDREIKSVKDERDRTIESIRSTTAGEAKWTEKTAEQRIKILEAEAARLDAKVESLDRENRDLRAKMNKPVTEAIADAQQLAGMTGMIRAEDAPTKGEDEGEFDIKKSLVKMGGTLIEKGPEIMEKFQQIRQQNAQRQVAVAPQQNGQAVRQLPPTQMTRQMPPQQRRVAPPPGMASAPQPAWSAAPLGPPMPSSIQAPPPYQGAPPPGAAGPMLRPAVVYGPTPEGSGTPAVGQQPATRVAPSPVQPPPFAQPAAAPEPEMPTQWMGGAPATPVQAAPPPVAATGTLDGVDPALVEQGMGRFVNELDNAIREKVLSPLAFANLFIAEVGAPVAAQLMQSIPPEQIISVVASLPDGDRSQIVTREGQKYVRAVWLACATQLGLVAA